MAYMNCRAELPQLLLEVLGLPKLTRWFEVHVAVDKPVTVRAEHFVEDSEAELRKCECLPKPFRSYEKLRQHIGKYKLIEIEEEA